MDTKDALVLDATDLVGRAVQAGRDQMAEVLAGFLGSGTAADEHWQAYNNGVEDALITLINAGATDPR